MIKAEKNSAMLMTGALIGGLGVIAGMLFAPKSGHESREQIAAQAKSMKDSAKGAYDDMKEKRKQQLESAKDTIQDLATDVKSKTKKGKDNLKDLATQDNNRPNNRSGTDFTSSS